MADAKPEGNAPSTPDNGLNGPRAFRRAKEDGKSPHHHKEMHGMRNDIDEDTPLSDVKAPNVFERAKEEIEALVQTIHLKKESPAHGKRAKEDDKPPHHRKEMHGMRNDIDENTQLSDVKAPNVFERAKEEIEALVQTIHLKKESPTHEKRDQTVQTGSNASGSPPENDGKGPNFIQKAKQEVKGIMHFKKSPGHHGKETHGLNEDIDENTPVDEVKAPNFFERAKEEIDAVVQAIHPKKESSNDVVKSPKKEHGFRHSVAKGLEKACSPLGHKRD